MTSFYKKKQHWGDPCKYLVSDSMEQTMMNMSTTYTTLLHAECPVTSALVTEASTLNGG